MDLTEMHEWRFDSGKGRKEREEEISRRLRRYFLKQRFA